MDPGPFRRSSPKRRLLVLLAFGLAACSGRSPARSGESPPLTTTAQEDWRKAVLSLPEEKIDLLEAISWLVSESSTPISVQDLRDFLSRPISQARSAFETTEDPERRIRILCELLLPRPDQGFSSVLRGVREVLSASDGDCVPLCVILQAIASDLGLPLQIVYFPGHVFLRYSGKEGERNIETTSGGEAFDSSQIVQMIRQARPSDPLPEAPEHLAACFITFSKRDTLSLLFFHRAEERKQKGNLSRALEDYRTALELTRSWPMPEFRMGLLSEGEWARAVEHLDRAIERAPCLPELYYTRGAAFEKMDRPERALEDHRAAVRLAPHEPRYAKALGTVLITLQKHEEAIRWLSQALKLDPHCRDARLNRAQVWQHLLKDYPQAIEDYSFLIRENPSDAAQWERRGTCYNNLHDYHEALGDLDRAVELNPRSSHAWATRALVLVNLGEPRKALVDVNKCIALDPTLARGYLIRSLVYERLGEHEKAAQDQRKGAALEPKR